MATQGKNLSAYDNSEFPHAHSYRVGIVVSEWNEEITSSLHQGAREALLDCGVPASSIFSHRVPGSFELPIGAQMVLEADSGIDAVICLGNVIRGETAHFDYVCEGCAIGIKDVSLRYNKPVMFGVLTDDNIEQSRARSGGSMGNKGIEAAIAALKLIKLQKSL